MPKFICISGKARAGKDTAAEILRVKLESQGNSVLVTHFADLLKYICKTYFGWDGNKDEHGRSLLQQIGTEGVRSHNPNYWVDFIVQLISMFQDKWDYVIVPDARFPNEIERIKKVFDSVHIRISRSAKTSDLTHEQSNHASEVALDGVAPDYYIVNDGTLDELEKTVWSIIDQIQFDRECARRLPIFDPIPPADGA